MTESTQLDSARRNRLLEGAQQEFARFEQIEREFRQRDQAERAAELRLPLDQINLH